MKIKLLGLFLGALVLGLAAVLAFVLFGTDRRGAEAGAPAESGASVAERADSKLDAPLLTPETAGKVPEELTPTALESTLAEGERRSTLAEGARWIEGRVLVPLSAPADETLRVVALAQASSADEIHGEDGLLEKLRAEAGAFPEGVVAVGTVESDGRFRLACPADRAEAWLALDGRFLYLASAVRVDVAAAPKAPIELLPRIGACLRGKILLPAGIERPSRALEDVDVELGLDPTQFSMTDSETSWMFDRGAVVDDAGAFELRAVASKRPHALQVQCDEFATWSQNGVLLEEGELRTIDITLGYGATVRGRVVGPGDAPIAGAEVQAAKTMIFGYSGKDGPTAQSGADGTFELSGVPTGTVGLTAEATGYLSPRAKRVEAVEGGEIDGVVLVLDAGAAITGIVRTSHGTPVSGAKVAVRFDPAAMMGAGAMNAARGAKGEAESDVGGRFRVDGLGKGPFLVEASAARPADADPLDPQGDWRARKNGVQPGSEIEIELLAPLEVTGRVVDVEGTPIPEYSLSVRGRSEVVFLPGTTRKVEVKDELGEFEVGDLSAGSFEIEARAKGFGPNVPVAVTLAAATPIDPVEIVLRPEASVSGIVRAPDGQPFAGAKVTVEVPASRIVARMEGSLEVPETYSAEDGTFRLAELGEGSVALVATHADFAVSEAVAVQIAPGVVTEGVEIELRRGGVLSGIVYDHDGEPLAGGQVILQAPTMVETNLRRTQEDGTFLFEKLRPGSWTVVAMLAEVGVQEADEDAGEGDMSKFLENMLFSPVEIKDGEESHVVLGKPPANPVAISGRVTHAGKPVGNGMVSFLPDGGSGFQDMKMDQTDGEGRYDLELNEPGRFLVSVQVMATGTTQNSVEFSETVPEGEEHRVDLALPLGRISGRVFGPEGDPMEGARVSLFHDGGLLMGSFMGGQYAEAATGVGGHYEFEFVRPGTYCIAAGGTQFGGAFGTHSEVGRSLQSGIRLGEDEAVDGIDFRLSKAGELHGTVRDASGAPAPNASVFLRDEAGRLLERFSMTASGSEGSFQYTGLAAGSYEVFARAKEQTSIPSQLVRVTEGQTSEVELTLARGTVIVVEIVDKEGLPSAATVSVRDGAGREWSGMIGWADMMSNLSQGIDLGVLRAGPVPPGSYTVEARGSDGRSTKKPVTLDGSDAERRVKLHFK